jgi:hypothetical protein
LNTHEGETNGDFRLFSRDDTLKMLENVKNSLPKKMHHRYTRSLKHFDWNAVKFGNYTGEDCRHNFERLLKQVRKHRNLLEITENCLDLINRKNSRYKTFRDMVSCFIALNIELLVTLIDRIAFQLPPRPKAPMTSFLLFATKMRTKMMKENPNLEMIELAKLTGEKWRNMSERKKAKYIEQYRVLKEEHKIAMDKYRCEHPEVFDKSPVKRVSKKKSVNDEEKKDHKSPFAMYLASKLSNYEEMTDLQKKSLVNKYRDKWLELSDKRKYKHIEMSIKSEAEYKQRLLDKYGSDHHKGNFFKTFLVVCHVIIYICIFVDFSEKYEEFNQKVGTSTF